MPKKAAMQIRFKKLCPEAEMPKAATAGSAGFDLVATSRRWNKILEVWDYGTGIAVEIPPGYVGLVFPRSSVYKTGTILSNGVGVIDSDYRGEIGAKFYTLKFTEKYEIGDRIAQLVIVPIPRVEWVESEELSATERGAGGYGSTGR